MSATGEDGRCCLPNARHMFSEIKTIRVEGLGGSEFRVYHIRVIWGNIELWVITHSSSFHVFSIIPI